jgi:hypothetical protein
MNSIELFSGFGVNLLVALVIVRGIYYPAKQDKDYVFTFLAFNSVIYFVMAFLTSAEISIGVGFGLFAIFSVLRYRTSTMSTRAMTYLFIVIALPVMNSVMIRLDDWPNLLGINAVIISVLYVLEQGWGFHYEASKSIKYDRIELITPENQAMLLDDLRQRTGLPVKRFAIGRINFLEDSADLRIYYDEPAVAQWPNEDEFDDTDS